MNRTTEDRPNRDQDNAETGGCQDQDTAEALV